MLVAGGSCRGTGSSKIQHSQAGREVLLLTEGSKHSGKQGPKSTGTQGSVRQLGAMGSLSDRTTLYYTGALRTLCSGTMSLTKLKSGGKGYTAWGLQIPRLRALYSLHFPPETCSKGDSRSVRPSGTYCSGPRPAAVLLPLLCGPLRLVSGFAQ